MAVDKNIIVAGLATVAGLAILTKTPIIRREAETVVFNARGFPKKLKIKYSYHITPDAITKFFQPTTGFFYRIRDVTIDENYKFVKQNFSYFVSPRQLNEVLCGKRLFDIYNDSDMPILFFTDIIMRKKNIDIKTMLDDSKGYYYPLRHPSSDKLWVAPYCEDLFKDAPALSRQTFDELGAVKKLATYNNGKFAEELWNCYTNGDGFSKDVVDKYKIMQLAMMQIYNYLFAIPMDKDLRRQIMLFTDEQKEESLANRQSESKIYEKHMDFVRKLYENYEYNPNNNPKQAGISRMIEGLKNKIDLANVTFGTNYFRFNEAYYEHLRYKATGGRPIGKRGAAYQFPLTAEDMISLYEWYYLKMYYYFYNASQPLYKELNEKNFDYNVGVFLNNIRGDWYAYRNGYDTPSRYNSIVKPIIPLKEIAERGYSEGFIKKTIIKKRPFFTNQIAKESKEWDNLLSGGRDEKAQKNAKELKDELAKNEPFKGLRLYQSYAFSEALKSLKKRIESAGNLITESEKEQAIAALKNAQGRDIAAEIANRKKTYDNEVALAKERYDNHEARLKRQQNQNEINLKMMMEELDED